MAGKLGTVGGDEDDEVESGMERRSRRSKDDDSDPKSATGPNKKKGPGKQSLVDIGISNLPKSAKCTDNHMERENSKRERKFKKSSGRGKVSVFFTILGRRLYGD